MSVHAIDAVTISNPPFRWQLGCYNLELAAVGPGRDAPYPVMQRRRPVRKGIVMAWLILVVAGLIETGWAIGLKYTEGFTRFWPSVFTIIGIVTSMVMLSISVRTLPIGTAYAIWVGIGAAGTVVCGIFLFGEPASLVRLGFLSLLLIAIIGLKMTAH